jgi:uncharacterized protein YecE (DUF72 family)
VPGAERSLEELSLKPAHIGCSGWHYAHWRGVLYPPGVGSAHWLECYAQTFDTVENNSAFYRLPTEATVAGWVSQTPGGFLFAVKVSRYVTHIRRLREPDPALEKLEHALRPMIEKRRLGPLLWQLPENFQRDDERLTEALSALGGERRHAFEFRHESWFCEPVYELLHEHGVALVIADHPERPFQTLEVTAPFVYLRLHLGRGRHGNYTSKQISHWAKQVQEWRKANEIFVYFNNDGYGCAVRNALALMRALDLSGAEPGLEWSPHAHRRDHQPERGAGLLVRVLPSDERGG